MLTYTRGSFDKLRMTWTKCLFSWLEIYLAYAAIIVNNQITVNTDKTATEIRGSRYYSYIGNFSHKYFTLSNDPCPSFFTKQS